MRRLRLIPLATVLGSLLLAGMIACTPSTPAPAGGAGSGGGTPPPAETTEEAPADAATTEEAAPADGTTAPEDGTTTEMPAEGAFDAANFYAMSCAGCHGAQGEGSEKGPAYSKVLHEPEEELLDAILNGKKEGDTEKMPGFADKLSAEEAKLLLSWVHTQFGSGAAPADGAASGEGAEGHEGTEGGEGEGH